MVVQQPRPRRKEVPRLPKGIPEAIDSTQITTDNPSRQTNGERENVMSGTRFAQCPTCGRTAPPKSSITITQCATCNLKFCYNDYKQSGIKLVCPQCGASNDGVVGLVGDQGYGDVGLCSSHERWTGRGF